MSNLDKDLKACERDGFGVNYGKWKLENPTTIPPKPKKVYHRCKYCGREMTEPMKRKKYYCNDSCRERYYYQRDKEKKYGKE